MARGENQAKRNPLYSRVAPTLDPTRLDEPARASAASALGAGNWRPLASLLERGIELTPELTSLALREIIKASVALDEKNLAVLDQAPGRPSVKKAHAEWALLNELAARQFERWLEYPDPDRPPLLIYTMDLYLDERPQDEWWNLAQLSWQAADAYCIPADLMAPEIDRAALADALAAAAGQASRLGYTIDELPLLLEVERGVARELLAKRLPGADFDTFGDRWRRAIHQRWSAGACSFSELVEQLAVPNPAGR